MEAIIIIIDIITLPLFIRLTFIHINRRRKRDHTSFLLNFIPHISLNLCRNLLLFLLLSYSFIPRKSIIPCMCIDYRYKWFPCLANSSLASASLLILSNLYLWGFSFLELQICTPLFMNLWEISPFFLNLLWQSRHLLKSCHSFFIQGSNCFKVWHLSVDIVLLLYDFEKL